MRCTLDNLADSQVTVAINVPNLLDFLHCWYWLALRLLLGLRLVLLHLLLLLRGLLLDLTLGWFLILGLSFCLSRGFCLLHIVF